jgi:hypothetical protein
VALLFRRYLSPLCRFYEANGFCEANWGRNLWDLGEVASRSHLWEKSEVASGGPDHEALASCFYDLSGKVLQPVDLHDTLCLPQQPVQETEVPAGAGESGWPRQSQ